MDASRGTTRTSVEVGRSSARRIHNNNHRLEAHVHHTHEEGDARATRHPRLVAWADGCAARLPGTLVGFAALACLSTGLAGLLAAIMGVTVSARVVLACALAPVALCALAQALSRHGAAWAALGCLVMLCAGVIVLHAGLMQEARTVTQAAVAGETADATTLVSALVAVLATTASFLSLSCHASWVMAIAAVPLVICAAAVGRPCPGESVALLCAYFALALPHDRVARRSGRPLASTCLVTCACVLGASAGIALATTHMDALSALPRALEARASQAISQIGRPRAGEGDTSDAVDATNDAGRADATSSAGSEPTSPTQAQAPQESREADGSSAQGQAADDAGTQATPAPARSEVATSGHVRRDALGEQTEQAHEVTLDHEPTGAVYLREFTGVDFEGDAWTAAGEEQMDDPGSFLETEMQDRPRLAQLVAENPQPDAASAESFTLATLAENVTYTTDMAPIPEGADIPEYVLFDGHEGYCQHFATIATLMLRAYDVPARYVAGYAAPASAFTLGSDGLWHAWLDGRSAHAWVEVWDGTAATWQVVETTPADTPTAATVDFGTQGDAPADDQAVASTQAQATDVQPAAGPDAAQEGLARSGAYASQQEASAQQDASPTGVTPASASAGEGAGAREGGFPGSASADDAGSAGDGDADSGTSAGSGASSAGEAHGEGGDAAGDGSETLGLVRRLLVRALIACAIMAALLACALVVLRRAARARRARILEARRNATAAGLAGEMLAALRFSGTSLTCDVADDAFADELARTAHVPQGDAEYLARAALRSAFGPAEVRNVPADERCRATYRAVCAFAYAGIGRIRRLAFTYVHAWL